MQRIKDPAARDFYIRKTLNHGWSRNMLETYFPLQRHSDHHEDPRRRYQAPIHYDASPQLPGCYPAMRLAKPCTRGSRRLPSL